MKNYFVVFNLVFVLLHLVSCSLAKIWSSVCNVLRWVTYAIVISVTFCSLGAGTQKWYVHSFTLLTTCCANWSKLHWLLRPFFRPWLVVGVPVVCQSLHGFRVAVRLGEALRCTASAENTRFCASEQSTGNVVLWSLLPERSASGGICCGDVAVCVSVCHVDVLCPNDWVDHHATFTRL